MVGTSARPTSGQSFKLRTDWFSSTGTGRDPTVELIHRLNQSYPAAVSAGLLERVRLGSELFVRTDELLAASGLIAEGDWIEDVVLAETQRDRRADAAAAVLGPVAAGMRPAQPPGC